MSIVHTSVVDGVSYHVGTLWQLAESIPIKHIPFSFLQRHLNDRCWMDHGEQITPHDVLADPLKPAHRDHWTRILRAEPRRFPILLFPNGQIADGMHRLALLKLACLDVEQLLVPVKQFDSWQTIQSATIPLRGRVVDSESTDWRRSRETILAPLSVDGDFLEVGCGDALLLESLIRWGRGRGQQLTPFGIDSNSKDIALARVRMPLFASHFIHAHPLEVPWPSGSLDFILTTPFVVDSGRIQQLFATYYAKLRKGGKLLIAWPEPIVTQIPLFDAEVQKLGYPVGGTITCVEPGQKTGMHLAWLIR